MNLEFDSSISINNVYATGVITGATLCGTTICGISKIFEGGSCLASLYLGIAACACDSKCLGAKPPAYYLNTGSTALCATTAGNALCLGAKLPAYYLNTGSTALCATTAGNALCLGAKLPAYYLNTGSTALCASTAGNALCLGGKVPAYYLNTGSTTNGQQTKFTVTQASHGLSVGNVIKSSGANTYVKATGDTAANAEVVGIVTIVNNINSFTFVTQGVIETGVPAQPAGTVMFLSPTSGGTLTATEPITIGQISKPLVVVLENGSKALFQIFRGLIITADGSYAPLDSPVFTTCVTLPTPFKIGAVQVNATGTVINYLTGATSNIQTQINAKAPVASPTFTGTITSNDNVNTLSRTNFNNSSVGASSRADIAITSGTLGIYLGVDCACVLGTPAYLDNRSGGNFGYYYNGCSQIVINTAGNLILNGATTLASKSVSFPTSTTRTITINTGGPTGTVVFVTAAMYLGAGTGWAYASWIVGGYLDNSGYYSVTNIAAPVNNGTAVISTITKGNGSFSFTMQNTGGVQGGSGVVSVINSTGITSDISIVVT